MNIDKININQSEQTYYIASDIYDVSAHNNGATFESLSTLLSSENLDTLIPTAVRCGGMSIRFIQSSDNKYVQYRLMTNYFSTIVSNWQGVDDEPTSGSDNIVKSGGVFSSINEEKAAINGAKSLVIYKTHLDNIKGPIGKRIPFKVIGQGENLTLRVKNSQVEYNGQEQKRFAVTFVKNNGEYANNIILYGDGEKTIINNDEIESIAVNLNNGIESLSLDIEVTNGDVLSDIESLKNSVSGKLIYPETFNLTSPNNIYKIDKKFKAGDVISLILKNFNLKGNLFGQYNVSVKDSTNTNIYVNNRPPIKDLSDNIIIPSDTDNLTVYF